MTDEKRHSNFLYTTDKEESLATYERIKRHKPKNWDPITYEMSVTSIEKLRELKLAYDTTGCYCDKLARNDWKEIKPTSLLRACSYCWKMLDVVMDYASNEIDDEKLTKWFMRKRRLDNFAQFKMMKLIKEFKILYESDILKQST